MASCVLRPLDGRCIKPFCYLDGYSHLNYYARVTLLLVKAVIRANGKFDYSATSRNLRRSMKLTQISNLPNLHRPFASMQS